MDVKEALDLCIKLGLNSRSAMTVNILNAAWQHYRVMFLRTVHGIRMVRHGLITASSKSYF